MFHIDGGELLYWRNIRYEDRNRKREHLTYPWDGGP